MGYSVGVEVGERGGIVGTVRELVRCEALVVVVMGSR